MKFGEINFGTKHSLGEVGGTKYGHTGSARHCHSKSTCSRYCPQFPKTHSIRCTQVKRNRRNRSKKKQNKRHVGAGPEPLWSHSKATLASRPAFTASTTARRAGRFAARVETIQPSPRRGTARMSEIISAARAIPATYTAQSPRSSVLWVPSPGLQH